ncbi:MAG: class I SAM-dependent rRNA methyltransferase [Cytophagales bacterium]
MNILQLQKGKEKALKNKHPWIFSGAVLGKKTFTCGEIVEVQSFDSKTLGFGIYDTNSQIVCKMFWFDKQVDFNKQFWFDKFQNAWNLRQNVINFETTNVYRFLHAEGDFVPGIICDIYNNTAVIQKMMEGIEFIQNHLIEFLKAQNIQFFYSKTNKIAGKNSELHEEWIGAKNPEKIIVKENNVLFEIDVENGQKTGFFIDQRENRSLLEQFSKGKKVLNTFSFSGGFSMYACRAQAAKVISVDISKPANDVCDNNYDLNKFNTPHSAITKDCFTYLREVQEQFDVIVLDPPAFAKSAAKVMNASRGYKDLNLLAFKLIKKGGFLFTFSCSQHIDKVLFQKIVFGAAADSGKNVRIIKWLSQPSDHPVNIYHPEGEYLKGLLLYVE